jgi:hypothetical protein
MEGFITISCNVWREALERIEGHKSGNDSFKEYLRSLSLGQGREPPGRDVPGST